MGCWKQRQLEARPGGFNFPLRSAGGGFRKPLLEKAQPVRVQDVVDVLMAIASICEYGAQVLQICCRLEITRHVVGTADVTTNRGMMRVAC